MKKLLTLVLVFAALAGIVSCGGDDDPKLDPLTIDGIEYTINNGYVIDYSNQVIRTDADGPVTDLYFYLSANAVTFDANGYRTNDPDGLVAQLRLYSQDESAANGDYTIVEYCTNFTFENEIEFNMYDDGDLAVENHSGTMTMTKNGDMYNFTFDGLLFDWNSPIGLVRNNGCNTNYETVPVTGSIKLNVTTVAPDKWSGLGD